MDKTYGDIIDEMETLLNNVRAEICDYYCKRSRFYHSIYRYMGKLVNTSAF